MRKRGVEVPRPPAMDPCPKCNGRGVVTPTEADAGDPPDEGLWV